MIKGIADEVVTIPEGLTELSLVLSLLQLMS